MRFPLVFLIKAWKQALYFHSALDWQAYIIPCCSSEALLYIDFINGGILFDWQWLIEMI